MNGIYLMAVRSHGGDGTSSQNPWINHNPNNDLDQTILNKWHGWFQKMDNAGILIYFFIYDDDSDPFYGNDGAANNTSPPAEQAFVKDLVNEFKRYKHLVWVVAEEYQEELGTSRVNQIISAIRSADTNGHPVAVHQLAGLTFNFASTADQFAIQFTSTSPSDCHADTLSAWNKASGRYNINFAEQFYIDTSANRSDSAYRKCIWATALGGGYIMQLGSWETSSGRKPPTTGMARASKNLVSFMERTTFNDMSPNDSLKSGDTDYVLANPGNYYIAYTDNYSTGIGLQNMTSGVYKFIWYDISNNKYVNQDAVSVSSGTRKWQAPSGFSGPEVAVFISATSTSPTITITPTSTPTPEPGVPGDGNNDGAVDGRDFIIWLSHFGQNVSGASNGNYNGDNTVDIADFVIWIKNY
jgi:hypothetical protein